MADASPDCAIQEGDDVVPVVRNADGLCPSEFLRRSPSHTPMDVALISPGFPVKKHGGEGIGQTALGVRHDEGGGAPWHTKERIDHDGGVKQSLTRTTSGTDDRLIHAQQEGVPLHLIHVYILLSVHLFSNKSSCAVFVVMMRVF